MNEIDFIYQDLCKRLVTHGKIVNGTRELNNVQFTLHDITQRIVSIRDISPAYLFGEWLWYFTGRNDVEFISHYGSMWKRLSDDGKTNNSAYGYLIQKAFGFNQIEKIIELLSADPDSRRAVININTPNERVIETKDEPCTVALQFLIRDGKLHCTAIMRSNDIWLGLPYDVAFFTELQMVIADRLGVEYGTYTHFVVSMHLYDRNYSDARQVAYCPIPKPFTFDRKKFHENATELADFLSRKMPYVGSEAIKSATLAWAENLFDFKWEK